MYDFDNTDLRIHYCENKVKVNSSNFWDLDLIKVRNKCFVRVR